METLINWNSNQDSKSIWLSENIFPKNYLFLFSFVWLVKGGKKFCEVKSSSPEGCEHFRSQRKQCYIFLLVLHIRLSFPHHPPSFISSPPFLSNISCMDLSKGKFIYNCVFCWIIYFQGKLRYKNSSQSHSK